MTSTAMSMDGVSDIFQHTPFDASTQAAAGSGSSPRRDASVRSVNSTVHSYSRHSRRVPHGWNPSDNTGGTIAAAIEDLERPVLPSVGSTAGSQVVASHVTERGARGEAKYVRGGRSELMGAGRVPYSSGRSVPHSSSHRSAWRGTPARTLKGAATSVHDERAMPPQSHGVAGSADGGTDGRQGVARRGLDRGGVADSICDGAPGDAGGKGGLGDDSSGSARGGHIEEAVSDVRASDAIASVVRGLRTAENSTTSAYASIGAIRPESYNAE